MTFTIHFATINIYDVTNLDVTSAKFTIHFATINIAHEKLKFNEMRKFTIHFATINILLETFMKIKICIYNTLCYY